MARSFSGRHALGGIRDLGCRGMGFVAPRRGAREPVATGFWRSRRLRRMDAGRRTSRVRPSGSRQTIDWIPANGSEAASTLIVGEHRLFPTSWSPDGRVLAYDELDSSYQRDIYLFDAAARGEPIPFLVTPANESHPHFSPDGRSIVYHSDESGRNEIYVRPYPGPGGKYIVSTNGGSLSTLVPERA